MRMRYRLGINVGTSSVGAIALALDDESQPKEIAWDPSGHLLSGVPRTLSSSLYLSTLRLHNASHLLGGIVYGLACNSC